jgi:hypothetical protein
MGIDYKDIAEWEVETPSGWKSFSGIKRVDKNKYVEITFESGQSFICSIGHKLKRKDGKLVDTKSVRKGTSIISKNGTFQKISSKKLVDEDIKLFDLIEVEDGHVYFTDELVSSNCAFIDGVEEIWLSAQYTLSTGGRSVMLSCVTDDTFVYTSRGIQQINEFVPSKKIGDYTINEYSVFGVDKERSSNLFKVNGKTDTIKITTKYSELESSKIHKLWAYKLQSHEFDWTEAQSLTKDDWISMQIGMDIWGNENNINFQPSLSNKLKNTINVDYISTELSYLFGLYIAEGYGRKVYNKNSEVVGGDITITCGDPEITWVFDKLRLPYSSSDMLHYTISSKNLIELFEYVGFDLSNKSNKKEIPNRLLKMSKDNIIWLLKGIFDGDGSTSKGEILLTSSSENLINQVRAILINFGILSCKRRIKKEKLNEYKSVKHKFNHDIFNLNIYGKHALKYFNIIGFNLTRKNDKKYLVSDKNLYRNSSHNTIPNTLELIKKLYKLSGLNTVKFKKLYGISLNGIINSKTEYKTNNISREIVLTLYNTFKHLLSEYEQLYWDKIINNNIVWVQIKDIEHNTNDVYDFSLPNDETDFWCHSVIYNGIIGHQTPNGVGNFFHRTWVDAEEGKNKFNTIRLPWHLHPERDQGWRDQQTLLSGVKGAAQECDCDFSTSGDQVVHIDLLNFQKETYICEPIEKRGVDKDYWIFSPANYTRDYIISADCARGDGDDFSAFNILDVETLEQVAEYKGKLTTKDYGNLLITAATEYNNALLIIENSNIGWATLQQVIDRGYENLFYNEMDVNIVEIEKQYTSKLNAIDKKSVPGFSTTSKSRPLIINKMTQYFNDKSITIHSQRLYDELTVFIWNGAKAEAMKGYNDDLVMSLAIGLWIRDTALRIRSERTSYVKHMITGIQKSTSTDSRAGYGSQQSANAWNMKVDDNTNEDLTWLIG